MKDRNERLEILAGELSRSDENERAYFSRHTVMVPSRREVVLIVKKLRTLMFPKYFSLPEDEGKDRARLADEILTLLKRQLTAAYSFADTLPLVDTEDLALDILERMTVIKELLFKDITAIYEGDPAARSPEEIILSYPGFYAISIYRIAHELYTRDIPYLPRMMTEYAHEKTGIDIHAGATVGEYFFIDHGTGIVIGETTTIGDRVKLYQGVTLGAKSFELDSDVNPIKGIKRHPDIGNDCVIYANATILGGNTKIGDGCTIGGNVWLTHSVPAGQTVYYESKK